jgi:hypothetical protein
VDVATRHGGRRLLIAVLVCLWLVLQTAAPAVLLLFERPQRFAWQMFSGRSGHPTFVLVWDDGTEEPQRLGQILPRVRADVPYEDDVPPYLCSVHDDLDRVRLEYDDARVVVHRCER